MHLVIFDCDGTLVDSQHNITAAMALAFAEHALPAPPPREILGVVGLSLAEAFAVLAPDATDGMRHSLAEHYRSVFADGRLQRGHEPLYPGVRETIHALRQQRDVVLGIATGKSKRGVARVLAQERWEGTFLTIQTADDHPSKPNPSMILTAMAEAGVGPDQTVMVGDTTFDVEMAIGAGTGAIGVAWGYHPPERLRAAGAHHIVDAGAGLLATIEERLRGTRPVSREGNMR
ncbi:MAG: HAD-IA family hydrolase [Hyphomicrobiaceae bacterium]|nr:HAD-IA family hydrolase [Hyphomicrobiaceae bacterium]